VPLVRVERVSRSFAVGNSSVLAVHEVSLDIESGESVGLIGESGSGKSTLGRLVLGLLRPDSGRIEFDGRDLTAIAPSEMRHLRSRIQVVFQEPREALNPRMRIGRILSEPLLLHARNANRSERQRRVNETLEMVSLPSDILGRYPRELSGGQQQRVGIARAIISRPQFIVLDEPTSSVDVSIRARLLRLLKDLQMSLGLTYLLISHDISTVREFSDRTYVMYAGRIVEVGRTEEVIRSPVHPYTRSLTSADLSPDPRIKPRVYSLIESKEAPNSKRSCVLVGRCPLELPACSSNAVELRQLGTQREVACIRAEEIVSWSLEESPA